MGKETAWYVSSHFKYPSTYQLTIPQEEAIPESLKNILLLMSAGGFLVPPSQDPSKEEIWTETKKRLERFLPDLFKEIFPDASNENPQQQPASEVSSPKPSSQENPIEESSKEPETPAEPAPADAPADTPAETGESGDLQS